MTSPDQVVEVVLQPGDFCFGNANTRIRTLLGSCVSITMWHPELLIGGMCHYMLPIRVKGTGVNLDGKYAEDALQMFLRDIYAVGTQPQDYKVKLFGGGNMFPQAIRNLEEKHALNRQQSGNQATVNRGDPVRNVSLENVQTAYVLAAKYGFRIEAEDLGGVGYRQLIFEVWNGDVWVRKPTASA